MRLLPPLLLLLAACNFSKGAIPVSITTAPPEDTGDDDTGDTDCPPFAVSPESLSFPVGGEGVAAWEGCPDVSHVDCEAPFFGAFTLDAPGEGEVHVVASSQEAALGTCDVVQRDGNALTIDVEVFVSLSPS